MLNILRIECPVRWSRGLWSINNGSLGQERVSPGCGDSSGGIMNLFGGCNSRKSAFSFFFKLAQISWKKSKLCCQSCHSWGGWGRGGRGKASKAGCDEMEAQLLQGHMEPPGSLPQKWSKFTLGIRRLRREKRSSVPSTSTPPGF